MRPVPSTREEILARLAEHRTLSDAPRAEHEWLAAHGGMRVADRGQVVTKKGEHNVEFYALFKGHLVIRNDHAPGANVVFEWHAGDVGGIMPYGRGASPPFDAIAEEAIEALGVPKESFPEMIRECPVVTTKLVHAMVDRARHFTSSNLRDEKLISLGKLASGIAHELNNPSSAVLRSAKMLTEALTMSEQSARLMSAAHLTGSQLDAIELVREQCVDMRMTGTFSVVARADREEALTDWLDEHEVDNACAAPLSETTVTIDALEELAQVVPADVFPAALKWISSGCMVRQLVGEIETAARRMHDLVAAIKGFSYMDHAPIAEPVDLRRGIRDTLTLLDSKVRSKSIEVAFDVPADLPCAHGVGGELNQVWMNLIDNALDAAPNGGHVSVSGLVDHDRLVVRIVDDGAGIPPDIKGKIFDPFFTTKGVGKGTGLGLEIVRRLLKQHEGDISLESVPGRTEFQVRLPIAK